MGLGRAVLLKYHFCNVYCRIKGDFASVHLYGEKRYVWYDAVRKCTVGIIRYGTVRSGMIGMVR